MKLYPPGLRRSMSNADYQQSTALSVSQVKRLRKSPFHYHALTLPSDAPPKAPAPALLNGTLTHCAFLEPDEFDKRYWVAPDLNKNSNAFKQLRAEQTGLEVITEADKARAYAQAASLRALPDIADLMAQGEAEVSAFWFEDDPDMTEPVLCRCRPDWVSYVAYGHGCILVDVKTTTDASPEGFARACHTYDYHLQADWYTRGYERASGMQVHGFIFAVVESEYPHAAAVYMLSDSALNLARTQNREALHLYAKCRAAQSWPGYPQGIQVIDLPRWAYS
jgi:hypothetical protein